MVIVNLLKVARCKWVLLDQKVVRHHTQLHLNAFLLKTRNAEDVNITFVVLLFELPICIQHLDRLNAGGIEELVESRLWLIAPHLYIVGRKAKRLYQTITSDARMR